MTKENTRPCWIYHATEDAKIVELKDKQPPPKGWAFSPAKFEDKPEDKE